MKPTIAAQSADQVRGLDAGQRRHAARWRHGADVLKVDAPATCQAEDTPTLLGGDGAPPSLPRRWSCDGPACAHALNRR